MDIIVRAAATFVLGFTVAFTALGAWWLLIIGFGLGAIALCGIQTNHCVETAARMAGNLGYEVSFVLDACHAFDREGPADPADPDPRLDRPRPHPPSGLRLGSLRGGAERRARGVGAGRARPVDVGQLDGAVVDAN